MDLETEIKQMQDVLVQIANHVHALTYRIEQLEKKGEVPLYVSDDSGN